VFLHHLIHCSAPSDFSLKNLLPCVSPSPYSQATKDSENPGVKIHLPRGFRSEDAESNPAEEHRGENFQKEIRWGKKLELAASNQVEENN